MYPLQGGVRPSRGGVGFPEPGRPVIDVILPMAQIEMQNAHRDHFDDFAVGYHLNNSGLDTIFYQKSPFFDFLDIGLKHLSRNVQNVKAKSTPSY